MFLFSAALRSARAARARVSTDPAVLLAHRARRAGALVADDDPIAGGPFLHWVPDRPEGMRLAGEFVPVELPDPAEVADVAGRRTRRRR